MAERELASCPALGGRSPELINISKRGYGTTEELLALRRFGFAYAPDWVVLAFLTGNDLRNNSKGVRAAKRPYLVRDEDGELRLDESYTQESDFIRWSGWQGDLWYGLVARSRVAQVARHVRRQIKALRRIAEHRETQGEMGFDDEIYAPPKSPEWVESWRITEDILRMMRDEVQAHDAGFLLMTLSNPIQVNPDADARLAYAERLGVDDLFHADDRLSGFARDEGIPLLAMARPLRAWAEAKERCVHGFDQPFPCQGHWNEDGHREAGRALAARLCQELTREAPLAPDALEVVP